VIFYLEMPFNAGLTDTVFDWDLIYILCCMCRQNSFKSKLF